MWRGVRTARIEKTEKGSWETPPGRGDFKIWFCVVLFCLASLYTIVLSKILFPQLVTTTLLVFFFIFAFVYTPLISFVNARLDGMVGQNVSIPYIKEATIFLSGFRGIHIWFVDFGLDNYGAAAQRFREIELTGTNFRSILRAEVFMVPLVFITSFMYWSYIWKLAPIPSDAYPYVQLFWPLRALQRCVWITSTMRGEVDYSQEGTVTWTPANLSNNAWWYWRVRATPDDPDGVPAEERRYGPWSSTAYFYTNYDETQPPPYPPATMSRGPPDISDALAQGLPSAPEIRSADSGAHMNTPNPEMVISRAMDPQDRELFYQYEIDQVPSFDGAFLQSSDDQPILFEALKPWVIGTGFAVGLVFFFVLSVFGLPILLIFGYVQSLTSIPHTMITQIIGALIARYYFWNRFGKKQWRLYATVLAVGFSVGMALVGMASVSIAMIQKSVSVLLF